MKAMKSRHLSFALLLLLSALLLCSLLLGLSAAAAIPGDHNGDGEVTSADAILLLRGILTPETYPIADPGSADWNGDGTVNTADAVYLLRYSLLPEQYPLHVSSDPEVEAEKELIEEKAGTFFNTEKTEIYTGFFETFCDQTIGEALLEAVGLPVEGYSVAFDWDFDWVYEEYCAHEYVELTCPVTITGPKGGSVTFNAPLRIRISLATYIKREIAAIFNSESVWDGQISHDGYLELELSVFPSPEEITEYAMRHFDLLKLKYTDVTFSVTDNEYFRALRNDFDDAEIGDTVDDYIDCVFIADYDGRPVTYSPSVELVITKDESTVMGDYISDDLSYRYGEDYGIPTGMSTYTERPYELIEDADIYVAVDGSDEEGDGSFDRPYATFRKAQLAVRELKKTVSGDITVAFKAGEYRFGGTTFTTEDSGNGGTVRYAAYGDGEVILSGGEIIPSSSFEPLDDADKALFSEKAAEKIVKVDLASLGIDASGFWAANELYLDDERQVSARWPNVSSSGRDVFYHTGSGGAGDMTLRVPAEFAKRVDNYHSIDSMRVSGYFMYEWHNNDTAVLGYDKANRLLKLQFVDYGVAKPHIFVYGVSEELDSRGEYYIEKSTGTLYIYDPQPGVYRLAVRDIGMYNDWSNELRNVTFEGLTFAFSTNTAALLCGYDISFLRCSVHSIYNTGLELQVYDGLVSECELYNIGGTAIDIDAGDRTILRRANTVVDNNAIHDFAQIFKTYHQGVSAQGCGITISHNEFYNCPHECLEYGGNYIVIEYNIFHDAVQQSSDAGAVYNGRDLTHHGCEINYNVFYRIGNENCDPNAMYQDDGLCGISIVGNFVFGCRGYGIKGGNRDVFYKDNILVGCDIGFIGGFSSSIGSTEVGGNWPEMQKRLARVPFRGEIWAAAFPTLARINLDSVNADPNDPDNVCNPGNSYLGHNLVVGGRISIDEPFYLVSVEEDDTVLTWEDANVFTDSANGDYTIADPTLPQIPFDQIGRY